TALVIGESGSAGAFCLYDVLESRWFHTPFYEVVDRSRVPGATKPKPTSISWPGYITSDNVFPIAEPLVALASPPAPGISAGRASVSVASLGQIGAVENVRPAVLGVTTVSTSASRRLARAEVGRGPTLATRTREALSRVIDRVIS